MAVTPSKRHVNWVPVTWTPAPAGTPVTLSGVTNVEIDPRANVLMHSGDGDAFPTTKIVDFQDPLLTVTCRDLTGIHALAPGGRGALAATHQDAKNKSVVAGGGYSIALANALIENTPSGGQHRQYGDGRVMFSAESVDGLTNPLTFTAL